MSLEGGPGQPGPTRGAYRSPPAEHRFQAGVSGNPAGRPRKKPSDMLSTLVNNDQRARNLFLEEAYREVEIKVGGGATVKMTAIQAITRTMVNAGMMGDRHARRDILSMVQSAEAAQAALEFEFFKELVEYKDRARVVFDAYRKKGLEPPPDLPHPDDVEIDPRRGIARIVGPMNEAENQQMAQVVGSRDFLIDQIGDLRRLAAQGECSSPEDLVPRLMQLVERYNGAMSPRLRREVDDVFDCAGQKIEAAALARSGLGDLSL